VTPLPGQRLLEQRDLGGGVTEYAYEPSGKATLIRPGPPSGVVERPGSRAAAQTFRTLAAPICRAQDPPWDVLVADPNLFSRIRRECFVDTDLGGVESGGLLLGLPPMDGSLQDAAAQIWLIDASGPDRAAGEQGAAHVNLDWEAASHQRYFRHGDSVELVGDWHSHPGGDAEPSLGDFKGWARAHQMRRCPWVGLLWYRQGGWAADVYVTHTERGRVVCDRGHLLEGAP
jgi:proteasome lid subunit RPN8/RPN11